MTHNREISRAADRAVELSSGRIVHDGAPRGRAHRRAAVVTPCVPAGAPVAAVVVAWCATPGPVAAIALIVALGTGTFAGLGSTAEWRRQSNDASFAHLRMHDLQ